MCVRANEVPFKFGKMVWVSSVVGSAASANWAVNAAVSLKCGLLYIWASWLVGRGMVDGVYIFVKKNTTSQNKILANLELEHVVNNTSNHDGGSD